MELNGFVQNGVIVLTGGASLPEGTPVTVTCGVDTTKPQPEKKKNSEFEDPEPRRSILGPARSR